MVRHYLFVAELHSQHRQGAFTFGFLQLRQVVAVAAGSLGSLPLDLGHRPRELGGLRAGRTVLGDCGRLLRHVAVGLAPPPLCGQIVTSRACAKRAPSAVTESAYALLGDGHAGGHSPIRTPGGLDRLDPDGVVRVASQSA